MSKNIKYCLLLVANPISDSKAAEKIFKSVARLDILSRDLKIYMPGFYGEDKLSSISVLNELSEYNAKLHEDYHGHSPIFHTYCESVGEMYFNDTDFAQFMLDLENKSPRFSYIGYTELVVLPTISGEILYDKLCSFNLEPFVNEQYSSKCTIEIFLLSVIKMILNDSRNSSLELIDALCQFYQEQIGPSPAEDATSITIRVDNKILEHMKWSENGEIFFISYSTKDEYDAFALKVLLEKRGKQVWIAPDGIPSGFDYAIAIPAALRITTRFIVLLSHNSANSDWVRREIDRAISEKKHIDGIFLDNFSAKDIQSYDHMSFLFANIQLKHKISDLFTNEKELTTFLNNQVELC